MGQVYPVVARSNATAPAGAARRLQDMTLDERRTHLIPAMRAKRYNALARHVIKFRDAEPAFTPDQIDALCALLRGGAK